MLLINPLSYTFRPFYILSNSIIDNIGIPTAYNGEQFVDYDDAFIFFLTDVDGFYMYAFGYI